MSSFADAGEKRPFSVHDMLAMDRISDVRPSPDGSQLLFSLRKTDVAGNRGATSVWMVGLDGKPPRMVAQSTAGAWGARWAKDGSVLYLSGEGGTSQVWKLDLETTGSQRVTAYEVEVDNLEPFSDGRRLLLSMQVYPDLEELEETAVRDHERASGKVAARIYDDLLFRHWDTWEDGKRSHLFVYDSKTKYALDLMKGWDADCPTRPFGGFEEVAVAPDGSEVAFACKKVGREAAWSTDVDIWVVPSDGSAEPRCVTEDNEAYDSQPSYSPDGTKLAWLAMERPGYESDRLRIVVMDRASGAKRVVTEDWDRSASSISWSPDGQTIYTSAADLGQRAIFAIDVASGEATRLVAEGTNSDPYEVRRRLVYVHDDLNAPAEIVSAALDGSDVRRLTDLNRPRVASTAVGEFEQFTFAGWNDETVHGYVLKPVDSQRLLTAVDRAYRVRDGAPFEPLAD
jgi:dipeptidyl aminopeptidase/acylaminoacyl peptidase